MSASQDIQSESFSVEQEDLVKKSFSMKPDED